MGGAAFQDDISPEELFNRFFSGGGLGGSFGKIPVSAEPLARTGLIPYALKVATGSSTPALVLCST